MMRSKLFCLTLLAGMTFLASALAQEPAKPPRVRLEFNTIQSREFTHPRQCLSTVWISPSRFLDVSYWVGDSANMNLEEYSHCDNPNLDVSDTFAADQWDQTWNNGKMKIQRHVSGKLLYGYRSAKKLNDEHEVMIWNIEQTEKSKKADPQKPETEHHGYPFQRVVLDLNHQPVQLVFSADAKSFIAVNQQLSDDAEAIMTSRGGNLPSEVKSFQYRAIQYDAATGEKMKNLLVLQPKAGQLFLDFQLSQDGTAGYLLQRSGLEIELVKYEMVTANEAWRMKVQIDKAQNLLTSKLLVSENQERVALSTIAGFVTTTQVDGRSRGRGGPVAIPYDYNAHVITSIDAVNQKVLATQAVTAPHGCEAIGISPQGKYIVTSAMSSEPYRNEFSKRPQTMLMVANTLDVVKSWDYKTDGVSFNPDETRFALFTNNRKTTTRQEGGLAPEKVVTYTSYTYDLGVWSIETPPVNKAKE